MFVWILQTGEPLNCDGKNIRPMRAINLSSALISKNHKVEIISTRFYHQKKIFRKNSKTTFYGKSLTETLINSSGYKSNLGIARLIDHHILFISLLLNLFRREKKPDLIFIGYPPIEWSLAAVIYAKIKNIPIILDIKDIWPDIFWDNQKISKTKRNTIKFIFIPYRIYASIISTLSDYITGPTLSLAVYFKNKYKNLFLKKIFSLNEPKTFSSPIVPPKENALEPYQEEDKLDPNITLRILFIGSLMSIYDFETVSKSLKILSEKGIKYKFYIAGGGGSEKQIKRIFNDNSKVHFLGWVNRDKALELSKECHLAIAPYQNILNYKLNLVNKYIDYMSLALPILSPVEGYVQNLIDKYDIGWNYKANNALDLSEKFLNILESKKCIEIKSKNAYNLYKNKYKYEIVYNDLVNKLEGISAEKV